MKYSFWHGIKGSYGSYWYFLALICLFIVLKYVGNFLAFLYCFSLVINLIKKDIASGYTEKEKILPIKKRDLYIGRSLSIWFNYILYFIVYSLLLLVIAKGKSIDKTFVDNYLVFAFMALNIYNTYLYFTINSSTVLDFMKIKFKDRGYEKLIFIILIFLWVPFLIFVDNRIEIFLKFFEIFKNRKLLTFNILFYLSLTTNQLIFMNKD